MQTLELDLVHTILVSMIVLFAGRALVANIGAVLLAVTIDTPDDEVKALLELTFERTDYLAFGSAQGVKISKGTGLRGVAIPLHPAAAAYFGAPAPAQK